MSSKNSTKDIFLQILIIITSIGLLGSSTHLALRGNFLVNLLSHGGPDEAWGNAALIIFGFIGGIILLIRHILEEGVGESFYEYPPI